MRIRFPRLAGAACALAGAFTLTGSMLAATPAQAACPSVLFYGVRGSGEFLGAESPKGNADNSLGVPLTAVYRALETALPTSAGYSILGQGNQYSAPLDLNEIISLGASYYASVTDGVSKSIADISAKAGQCPSAKIVFAGYSSGADVVRRTLATGALNGLASRMFVLLMGDPDFHPEPMLLTGAGSASDSGIAWDGWEVGWPTVPQVPALNPLFHVENYCHTNDGVCNLTPASVLVAITAGVLGDLNTNEPHETYTSYDGVPAADRIIQYFGLSSPVEPVATARMSGVTCSAPGVNQANFTATNGNSTTAQPVTLTATFFNVFGSAEQTTVGQLAAGQTAKFSLQLPDALTSSVMLWASAPGMPLAYDPAGNLVTQGQMLEHQLVPAAC